MAGMIINAMTNRADGLEGSDRHEGDEAHQAVVDDGGRKSQHTCQDGIKSS